YRVDDLDAGAARGCLQANHIGQRVFLEGAKEVTVALLFFGNGQMRVFAAIATAVVILHVYELQRGVRRVDLDLATERLAHLNAPRKACSASHKERVMRRAHSVGPVSSPIRSWRISI